MVVTVMIATDRPRMHLCGSCVAARGLEHDGRWTRVAVDAELVGACDDCKARSELEAWRPLEVPPAAPTVPQVVEDPTQFATVTINRRGTR